MRWEPWPSHTPLREATWKLARLPATQAGVVPASSDHGGTPFRDAASGSCKLPAGAVTHSLTHPLTHSLITHSHTLPLAHSLFHLLTHSLLTHSHLLTHSLLTLSLAHSFTHSLLIHSLTHSLLIHYSFTHFHLLTHSFTHSLLIHPLTHYSFMHAFIHLLITDSFTDCSLITHSLIHYSFTHFHLLTHLCIHSYSFTHAFIHSLIHSFPHSGAAVLSAGSVEDRRCRTQPLGRVRAPGSVCLVKRLC